MKTLLVLPTIALVTSTICISKGENICNPKMIASKDFVTYSDDSFSSSTDGREFNFQTNSVRHT